jgi:putative NADPH-quinone reductase
MRVLLVYCHPCPESFTAAVRDCAVRTLTAAGHEVRVSDLYGDGFDPVMGAAERRGYHDPVTNAAPVAEHLNALKWCEGLVFVYPTWWYGPPAMLKGWLDRVWIPHETFKMPEPGKPIARVMTNIRLIAAISTLGSPGWWWKWVMGEPGRRIMVRGIRPLVAPKCRTIWLSLHQMDSTTDADRRGFLAKVEKTLKTVR